MYGKVFDSMYDGTLASRGPWQALVTFQQMIVLADKAGMVDMTADAIARRTSIPLEIIELGIVELMKPDPRSRTPDEDGRRIVLLDDHRDWGWQIVNHAKYQAMRSAEERREYLRIAQAERRARLRGEASTGVNVVNTQSAKVNTSTPEPTDAPAPVSPPPPLRGEFARFWETWPSSERKVARKQCAEKWARLGCEEISDQVLTALRGFIDSPGWRKDAGAYIPAPLVWLNQRRWEAPMPHIEDKAEAEAARAAHEARAERFNGKSLAEIEAVEARERAAAAEILRRASSSIRRV